MSEINYRELSKYIHIDVYDFGFVFTAERYLLSSIMVEKLAVQLGFSCSGDFISFLEANFKMPYHGNLYNIIEKIEKEDQPLKVE